MLVGLAISALCAVGGVAGLLAGVGAEAKPPLRFDPNPLVLPTTLKPPGEWDVVVDVVNRSGEPARIVGVVEYCSSACFSRRGLPLTVPARGRARLTLGVAISGPGRVSDNVTFYTDQPSQPELILRVEGNFPNTLAASVSELARP
jgi:hypothetical protein